jgi:ubiquinone/menaquinone biosynthesis C-methylase UbiE
MTTDVVSQDILSQQYKSSSNLEARIDLHERFCVNRYGWHRWIFDQFDLPSHANVLELGCGVGRLWQDNAGRIPKNWRITLTDFSSGMLDKAKQNTSAIDGQFAYEVVDVTGILFDSDLFDAVIANHMLYYLANQVDKECAFVGIRRVLKHGGKFYASTNGSRHMREMEALVNEFDPSLPFVTQVVRNFTLESGPIEVAEWFGDVELRRYDDELVVTDAQPLIDYILSASATFRLESGRKAALSEFVRKRFIEQGGAIRIRKDSGIICAKRLQ